MEDPDIQTAANDRIEPDLSFPAHTPLLFVISEAAVLGALRRPLP